MLMIDKIDEGLNYMYDDISTNIKFENSTEIIHIAIEKICYRTILQDDV